MDSCDRAVLPKGSFFADQGRATPTCGCNESLEKVVGNDTGFSKWKYEVILKSPRPQVVGEVHSTRLKFPPSEGAAGYPQYRSATGISCLAGHSLLWFMGIPARLSDRK